MDEQEQPESLNNPVEPIDEQQPNVAAEQPIISPETSIPVAEDGSQNNVDPTDQVNSPQPSVESTPAVGNVPTHPQAIVSDMSAGDQTVPQPIGDLSSTQPKKWYQKLKMPGLAMEIIAAVILISGLSAAAYFGYVVPNKPSNVVKAAIGNVLDPKTPQTYTVNAEVDTNNSSTGKVVVGVIGGMDKDGNTRVDISTEFSAFKISGSIIARVSDKELYIKVDQLPSLLNLVAGGQSSSGLQQLANTFGDKWLRLSVSDIQDAGFIDSATAVKANKCVDAYASYITASKNDMEKQFGKVYSEQNFATITKVGQDTISGQKMTKFKVAIDQPKLKSFAENLGKQFEGSTKDLATKCGFADTSSIADKASTSSGTGSVQIGDIYMWVNSKKQMGKLTATVTGQDSTKVTLSLIAEDKQVDTAKPTNVLTIKELNLTQLMDSFSGFSGSL